MPTGTAILDIDNDEINDSGNFDAATDIDGVNFSPIGSSSIDAVKAIVFTYLGRPLNVSNNIYITIGRETSIGSEASAKNKITIEIGEYTGRISYSED